MFEEEEHLMNYSEDLANVVEAIHSLMMNNQDDNTISSTEVNVILLALNGIENKIIRRLSALERQR